MKFSSRLDQVHHHARENKWLWYLAIFTRLALAAGFLPSGLIKIMGERFTSLSVNHPMGHYLEALHLTGYYYTFIGILQVTAAILLLIPRTVTLGAIIYFPLILNICILSFAVRFEGSLFTAPLMVLGNIYLLCWDYHKLKLIFPFNSSLADDLVPTKKDLSAKFPVRFAITALTIIVLLEILIINAYSIVPRNTLKDCECQCTANEDPDACMTFCNCIHTEGKPLNQCLEEYNQRSRSDKNQLEQYK